MSRVLENAFTSYDLTDKELLAGQIFTSLQVQVLRNLLSQYANDKLVLIIDSQDFNKSLQKEAELSGQISLLQYLLAQSEDNQRAVLEQARA